MTPDEILEILSEYGITISKRTIYNWARWGAIPPARFKNSRTAEYPNETPAECVATWHLLHGDSLRVIPTQLREIRDLAFRLEMAAVYLDKGSYTHPSKELLLSVNGCVSMLAEAHQWLMRKQRVMKECR